MRVSGAFLLLLAACSVSQLPIVPIEPLEPEEPEVIPVSCGLPSGSFYTPVAPTTPAESGQVIACELLENPGIVEGYTGYRVKYRTSSQLHEGGSTTEVARVATGLAFVPNEEATSARPILANTHGTTGIIKGCAPSASGSFDRSVLVDALGSVVPDALIVAPDFMGLGLDSGERPPDASRSLTDPLNVFTTIRPLQNISHPYPSLEGEGRATIDLVRAARFLPNANTGLSPRWLVIGQSQGGHAALSTGEVFSRGYGAELELLGVVAGAPGAELDNGAFMEPELKRILISMTLAGLSIEWRDLRASTYLTNQALAALHHTAAKQCLTNDTVLSWVSTFNTYLFPNLSTTRIDPTTDPIAAEVLRQNTPGYSSTEVPVFIGQVTGDPFVDHRRTEILVERERILNPGKLTVCFFAGENLGQLWPLRANNHNAFGAMFAPDAATRGTCTTDAGTVQTDALSFVASLFQ